MKKVNLLLLSIVLLVVFSCSQEEKESVDANLKRAESNLVCGNVELTGSAACCVPDIEYSAAPGETLELDYATYFLGDTYVWEVVSGAIAIVDGQSTTKVTLQFGDDFTGGNIRAIARANNGRSECTIEIPIAKK